MSGNTLEIRGPTRVPTTAVFFFFFSPPGCYLIGGPSGFFCCPAPLIALFGASPRGPGAPSAEEARPESPRRGTAGPHHPPGDRALPSPTPASPRREFPGSGSTHRGRTARDRSSSSSRTCTPGRGSRHHSRPRLFATGQAADPLCNQRASSAPPLTPESGRGPSRLQDRLPVHRSYPGTKSPRDGTLVV
ncbi:hypothetical protein NDU88_007373 [Pleurodeles waltl]|uniref:Uncharacterized protein n=1 Tax=Pleurodeles waltl TaxID=8319 RepID=A0AAV7N1V9_PLEWA|nr:hypothetical protein NDU88_007373 [Pleurodeles waltl]